jgi:chaperonin GroES
LKIQPLDDRILVIPAPAEERTASGIIIPDAAKEKPRSGVIFEVGNDEELQELLSRGDTILYGRYAGDEVEYEGDTYIILNRADILAKIA